MEASVLKICSKDAYPFLLGIHYAHRIPPISYAYGLFVEDNLVGVITYGVPVSSTLRAGVCGKDYQSLVLELNRLCLFEEQPRNSESFLIGKSLKLLPRPKIIVSFADTAQNHIGYVYQATNFIYTGLSAKRTDWKIKGMEHLHGATISDMSRGQKNRAEYMRNRFGDRFYLAPRPRKHRYIYFIGNKREVKDMKSNLKYPVMPYPKVGEL